MENKDYPEYVRCNDLCFKLDEFIIDGKRYYYRHKGGFFIDCKINEKGELISVVPGNIYLDNYKLIHSTKADYVDQNWEYLPAEMRIKR